MIKNYNGVSFETLIKDKVLVVFYADWCSKCKFLDEYLNDIDKLLVLKVNVDKYKNLTKKYAVMSVPCLIIFEDGKEINRTFGALRKDEFDKSIE